MMRRGFRDFGTNTDGSSTIQFVVVFLGVMSVMTFVIQTAIYLYMVASMQKAAEAGVRMAVVSAPMAGGSALLQPIGKRNSHDYGERCLTPQDNGSPSSGDPCTGFAPFTCGGGSNGSCAAPFNTILAEMQGYNGSITAQNVTITYTDVGIGFAGGPRKPLVTVKISGVAFDGGLFGMLLSYADDAPSGGTPSLLTLPSAVASMPAESLGQ